ncbi:GNAT family N-acetyltransferase [Streptomyces sp. bgisy100]|uniref:GNAT family N-acetyltransferase n=1 Tax=Streptomyces sp. bgisy100 TaxID=3413783 RepID=UPI003D70A3EB
MTVTVRLAATASRPALLLRPWEDGDADALIEAYRDPAVGRAKTLRVTNHADARRWLDIERQGWADGHHLSFAVLTAAADGGDEPVGYVVLKRPDPAGPRAEVGYWTMPRARGRGVAPRALEALTHWAFETFAAEGLKELELLHQADNTASCRVAEKGGFPFVRVLPPRPPQFPLDEHLHLRRAPA